MDCDPTGVGSSRGNHTYVAVGNHVTRTSAGEVALVWGESVSAAVGVAAEIDGTSPASTKPWPPSDSAASTEPWLAIRLQPLHPDARRARDQVPLEAIGRDLRKHERSDQLEGYEREQSGGSGAHLWMTWRGVQSTLRHSQRLRPVAGSPALGAVRSELDGSRRSGGHAARPAPAVSAAPAGRSPSTRGWRAQRQPDSRERSADGRGAPDARGP